MVVCRETAERERERVVANNNVPYRNNRLDPILDRPTTVTDLVFSKLLLDEILQMLLRYSDGLSRVLESALANLGGMNGSTMCLLTRWDVWLVLISSVSAGGLAGGTSGCWCSPQDASDLLTAVPKQRDRGRGKRIHSRGGVVLANTAGASEI